jgi:hypothetical protein
MEETMLGLETSRPRRAPLAHVCSHVRSLACVLAAAALAACAPAGHLESAPSPAANRILVHNQSWARVAVYLARRGDLWRLGELDGLSDGSFSVPRWASADLDEVYFVARPLAGTSFRSESFSFAGGATAVWTIASQSTMSYVALRR